MFCASAWLAALAAFAAAWLAAAAFALAAGESLTVQPLTKRKAFQILLQKLRPCSHITSSNGKSLPAGEVSNIPTLTPSAPYFSMRTMGSGELPSDLDILRPNLSRTVPV